MELPLSGCPVAMASREDDWHIHDSPFLLDEKQALRGLNLEFRIVSLQDSSALIQSSASMTEVDIFADQGRDSEKRGGEWHPNFNDCSLFDYLGKGMRTVTAGVVSLFRQHVGKIGESCDTLVYSIVRCPCFADPAMFKPFNLSVFHVLALFRNRLCSFFMGQCFESNDVDLVTPKPRAPSPAMALKTSISSDFVHAFGTLLILSVLFCQGSAVNTEPVKTNQLLPPVCVRSIAWNDCPIKADSWNNEWANLNTKCCSGFPGTVLVCQRGHDLTGDSYNFPACLPDKLVPAGHFGNLTKDDRNSPVFLVLPCNASTEFEDKNRLRSDATYPQCTPKSKCDGEGQELLCKRDSLGDDLCTCAVGFNATGQSCEKGFTQNDGCVCEKLFCPSGLVPARTTLPPEPRMCSELSLGFAVQSFCTKLTTTPVPSTPRHSLVTILRTATPANGPPAESSTTPNAVPLGTAPPDQPRSDEGRGKQDTVDIAFRGLGLSVLVIFALGLFVLVSVERGWIG